MKNIIFIMADDLGCFGLNCYGNNEIITPNIDSLAENGILYNNFYCTSPVCSPARASILTGTMPSEHGVVDWINGGNFSIDVIDRKLRQKKEFKNEKYEIKYLNNICYTDILKNNGYKCGLVGKWHLGSSSIRQAGFDYWRTLPKGYTVYTDPEYILNGKLTKKNGYVSDLITDDAIEFIDNVEDKFYLSVHYTAPHSPWDKKDQPLKFWNLYNDKDFRSIPNPPPNSNQIETAPVPSTQKERKKLIQGYFTSITAMDYNIGKIIQRLKLNGLFEDTIIIFTSDNGFNIGHHGLWGKGNASIPLNMFDTSTKVPLIISNHKKKGNVNKICSQYDIFPTILDLCGIEYKYNNFPGSSLFAKYREDKEIVVFSEYGPIRMIREGNFKLIYNYPYGPHELYNVKDDPNEIYNLIDLIEYENVQIKLLDKMCKWFEKYTVKYDARILPVDGRGQKNILSNMVPYNNF